MIIRFIDTHIYEVEKMIYYSMMQSIIPGSSIFRIYLSPIIFPCLGHPVPRPNILLFKRYICDDQYKHVYIYAYTDIPQDYPMSPNQPMYGGGGPSPLVWDSAPSRLSARMDGASFYAAVCCPSRAFVWPLLLPPHGKQRRQALILGDQESALPQG